MWAALLALGAGRWGLGRVGAAGAGVWAFATTRQLLRQPLAVPNTGHRVGAHGFAGACHACRHAWKLSAAVVMQSSKPCA